MITVYSSVRSICERFSERIIRELSDRNVDDPEDGVVDDIVERAIEKADNTINAYIAAQVELPFQTLPAIITDLSETLAFANLHEHLPARPETVIEMEKMATRKLELIAAGKISLGLNQAKDAEAVQEGNFESGESDTCGKPLHVKNTGDWC